TDGRDRRDSRGLRPTRRAHRISGGAGDHRAAHLGRVGRKPNLGDSGRGEKGLSVEAISMNGTRWSTGESLMMVSTTPVSKTSFESLAASANVRAISSSFHHFHLGSGWLLNGGRQTFPPQTAATNHRSAVPCPRPCWLKHRTNVL